MVISKTSNLSYSDAGVNINRGNELVDRIRKKVSGNKHPGVIGGIGGFGGLFDISELSYKKPVLVSGTDGVGTKLKLAIEARKHDQVGIDLVAMCVNDLLVLGAEPLFFLDYYATGRLDVETGESIIQGIIAGCEIAGCALLGGETAEMPGMYHGDDYDLAGFCVGIVEKENIIDGHSIVSGDSVIAVASSGLHSNGYSLVRKVLQNSNTSLSQMLDGKSLQDILLEPTRIYVKPVREVLKHHTVKGISHITGGGLIENLPRILPDGIQVSIDLSTWERPEIFNWIQATGNITETEMFRVFNCGVGLIIIVDKTESSEITGKLNSLGERAWHIGTISEPGPDADDTRVIFA